MDDRAPTLEYDRFGVSPTRGFLPTGTPLKSFETADPFLEMLDRLGDELPQLLEAGELRSAVRELRAPPVGLFDGLGERELVRVYRLTGFLANAYVHAEGPSVDVLPGGVAIPLYESTRRLGRTPVLSYDVYVLHNWTQLDADRGLTPENVRSLTNFVTLRDERWFVAIHVAIENAGGPAIGAIGDFQQGVLDDDAGRVCDGLRTVEDALDALCDLIDRMPEHNAPENYSGEFRQYLASVTDVEYEGVAELDGPQSFRGASGAQSSLLPALDAALGIDHGDNPLVDHLRTLRRDMPPNHRAFVEAAANGPSVREFVAGDDSRHLRAAYNDCLRQLVAFRERHIDVVKQYVAIPLGETTGTGGTPYARYLDSFTEDTCESLL